MKQDLAINESTSTFFDATDKQAELTTTSTKSSLITTSQSKQTDWVSILIGFSTIAINSLLSSLVTFGFGST